MMITDERRWTRWWDATWMSLCGCVCAVQILDVSIWRHFVTRSHFFYKVPQTRRARKRNYTTHDVVRGLSKTKHRNRSVYIASTSSPTPLPSNLRDGCVFCRNHSRPFDTSQHFTTCAICNQENRDENIFSLTDF
jgi:hypothetical protein